MSETMPLIGLANRPAVKRRVSGLSDTIRQLHRTSAIQDAYTASIPRAPRRPERKLDFFVPHTGTVTGPSNRIEEHLAIALVNDDVTFELAQEQIRLLHYQTPLKAEKRYKAPENDGLGDCDLVGCDTKRVSG